MNDSPPQKYENLTENKPYDGALIEVYHAHGDDNPAWHEWYYTHEDLFNVGDGIIINPESDLSNSPWRYTNKAQTMLNEFLSTRQPSDSESCISPLDEDIKELVLLVDHICRVKFGVNMRMIHPIFFGVAKYYEEHIFFESVPLSPDTNEEAIQALQDLSLLAKGATDKQWFYTRLLREKLKENQKDMDNLKNI